MRPTLAILCLFVMAGCGGDSTGPNARVTGQWNLKTINNAPLPYSGVSNGTLITIKADVLTMNPDGSYNDVTTYTITSGTSVLTGTNTELGNWQAANGAVSFYDATDGTNYTAQVDGSTLTELVNGAVQVYVR